MNVGFYETLLFMTRLIVIDESLIIVYLCQYFYSINMNIAIVYPHPQQLVIISCIYQRKIWS